MMLNLVPLLYVGQLNVIISQTDFTVQQYMTNVNIKINICVAQKSNLCILGNKSVSLIVVARLYVDLWCDGAPEAALAERPLKPSTADV